MTPQIRQQIKWVEAYAEKGRSGTINSGVLLKKTAELLKFVEANARAHGMEYVDGEIRRIESE